MKILNQQPTLSHQQSSINKVIDLFGRSRLLSFDRDPATHGPTVEVAHEALLREWARLRGWLNESRGDIRLQRMLAQAAGEWEAAGREASYLLSGARLAQFEGWAANASVALTPEERAFYEASIAERERREKEEAERQRRELATAQQLAATERARAESESKRADEQAQAIARVQLRNRAIAIAGGVALVLAVVAGLFALQSNRNAMLAQANAATAVNAQAEAEQAAKNAFSRELAGAAINNLAIDPERSVLLAIQGVSVADTVEAENALHQAVQASRVRLSVNVGSYVYRVDYSPDGKRLVTASEDGAINVWDTITGKNLLKIPNPPFPDSIDFSLDGKRLAGGFNSWGALGGETVVKVWDAASGRVLFTLPGCMLAAYSPDVQHMATACWDDDRQEGNLQIWNAATGQELQIQARLTEAPAFKMAYSPDGRRVAMGHGKTATLWDATTGQELLTLPEHTTAVWWVAFSSDGKRLATAGPNGPVKVWNITPDAVSGSSRLLATLPGSAMSESGSVNFSPDGTKLAASTGTSGVITIWDATTYDEILTLAGHVGPAGVGGFSPDNAHLATFGADGKAKIWDITPTHELLTLSGSAGSFIRRVAFSPDGTRLVADTDPMATVWDAATGRELFKLVDSEVFPTGVAEWTFGSVASVAYSPDGTHIATANQGATISLGLDNSWVDTWNQTATAAVWDAATGRKLLTLRGHTGAVSDVAFSPDGRWLATASRDGTAIIWDATTGQRLSAVSVGPGVYYVFSVAFSQDGTQLVTGAFDDLPGPHPITTTLVGVGTQLGTGETGDPWNSIVQTWSINQAGQLSEQPSRSLTGGSLAIALNPDGKHLAIPSYPDADIEIWDILPDVSEAKPWLTVLGEPNSIRGLAFNPDGTRLAAASENSVAKIWDVSVALSAARELLTLTGYAGMVNGVAFSPDGRRLATAGADGTVRIYALRLEDLIALAKTRVTRELTDVECVTYLHMAACPKGP